MKNILFLFLILMIAGSCKKDNQVEQEISDIELDVVVERFDLAFGNANLEDLPRLKNTFPFMFPKKYTDSFWIAKMKDTLQIDLTKEVEIKLSDINDIEQDIESLFKHIKYYIPEFSVPRVVSTTSYVDYRNKVIVTDTIALISMDTYLGDDHHFYDGIQNYIKQNFNKEQIVVDLAGAYANEYIYQQQNKTLLDDMIFFGKQLYFKDKVIPFKTDAEKIGYTQEQLNWSKANESYVWRHFVDKELLFSSDSKLPNRFINPAPFSKFYLEQIDKESPGRIGQYIGWQIVRAYMNNNDVSLKDLLNTNAEDIFNKSKFKPRK